MQVVIIKSHHMHSIRPQGPLYPKLQPFSALWTMPGTGEPVQEETFTHSPTHTYHGYQSSLMCFPHLLWTMASFLLNLHAWQSFSTICLQVFFGLPLGLATSTSYSILSYSCYQYYVYDVTTCTWNCRFAMYMTATNSAIICNPITGKLDVLYDMQQSFARWHNSSFIM